MIFKNPTIVQIGQDVVKARKEGRLADARLNAGKVVALCRATESKQNLVRALMLSGQIERDSTQYKKALVFYKEAVGISRDVDEPLRFAHTLRHLADLYCHIKQMDLAEGCYRESLGVYRRESKASPGDLANAVRGFAVMKNAAGDNEEAKALWLEARNLYSALGIQEGIDECNDHLRS